MSPQSTIAHYRVTSKLGEGGMGEVWRATDTKLNREVAIKVLPPALAQDPDRLARFTREAQVLASLNHPNIAAIYGVEERALVMELIPGPTLAERIAQGAIPLEEALAIARQIAEALEYAHERGVIHRDLKPANIKVTPEGRVKVLDFGLAKALSTEVPPGNPALSPTLTMTATAAGVIIGTAAYMSPEQARGHAVDRRADIWAFGVVLFEMLSGRRLFEAGSISDTLAAVLRGDPEWALLPPDIPANVRTMLRRSLERDPRRRLRDIGDARLELEQPAPESAVRAPRRASLVPWMAAALLAVAFAALAFVHFRERPAPAQVVRFGVAPPQNGSFNTWIALSPDGRYLGFTATGSDGINRVWLRSLDSMEVRPIGGTERTITFFWSPDSRFLVFESVGKIKKVDLSGGSPQTLCDSPNVLLGGSWNADGVILAGSNIGPIVRISSAGGAASPVTRLEPSRGEIDHSDPIFLPDGRHFVYFRLTTRPETSGIYAGDLDTPPERQSLKRLQATDFSAGFAPAGRGPGHLLFLRDGALMAQAFDASRLETAGEPAPLIEQVGTNLSRAFFSVSAAGALAYRASAGRAQELGWFDRGGRLLGQVGEAGAYEGVALSPDNARVAYAASPPGSNPLQIWFLELAHGAGARFTFVPEGAQAPVWSPDGKHIAFTSFRSNVLYVKEIGGSGGERAILNSGLRTLVTDWSRDGRYLLYMQVSRNSDVWALADPLSSSPKPFPVADTDSNEGQGRLSPDGHWIAYTSDESGRFEIYVRPFPPGEGHAGGGLISSKGGMQPRWRADGKELFYIALDHKLMAVDIKGEPAFQYGTAHPLFTTPESVATPFFSTFNAVPYDVASDGRRFLVQLPAVPVESEQATVVLNWEALLKK
jgi:eukaryotic-like serine/threonine-protein kinase